MEFFEVGFGIGIVIMLGVIGHAIETQLIRIVKGVNRIANALEDEEEKTEEVALND